MPFSFPLSRTNPGRWAPISAARRAAAWGAAWVVVLWVGAVPSLLPAPAGALSIQLAPADGGTVTRRSGLFGNRFLHDADDPTVHVASVFTGEGINTDRGYLLFPVGDVRAPIDDVTLVVAFGPTGGDSLVVNEISSPASAFAASFDVLQQPGTPTPAASLLMDDLGDAPLGTLSLAPLAAGGVALVPLGPGGIAAFEAAEAADGLLALGLAIAGLPFGGSDLEVTGASLLLSSVPEPHPALLGALVWLAVGLRPWRRTRPSRD